jgi:hypothetical protein
MYTPIFLPHRKIDNQETCPRDGQGHADPSHLLQQAALMYMPSPCCAWGMKSLRCKYVAPYASRKVLFDYGCLLCIYILSSYAFIYILLVRTWISLNNDINFKQFTSASHTLTDLPCTRARGDCNLESVHPNAKVHSTYKCTLPRYHVSTNN